MWITRREYDSLIERITRLEQRESMDELTFGRYAGWCFNSEPVKDKFHPSSGYISGERVSTRELICLIANHFGFSYQPKAPGALVPPSGETKKNLKG